MSASDSPLEYSNNEPPGGPVLPEISEIDRRDHPIQAAPLVEAITPETAVDNLTSDSQQSEAKQDAHRPFPPPQSENTSKDSDQDSPEDGEGPLPLVKQGLRKGVVEIGNAGKLWQISPKFSQGRLPYVPGNVVDLIHHRQLVIGIIANQGLSHNDFGEPRQDSISFGTSTDGRFIIGAVADGVSEATLSHWGSDLATKMVINKVRSALEETLCLNSLNWTGILTDVRASMRERGMSNFITSDATDPATHTETALDHALAQQFGTTADALVVDTKKTNEGYPFVRCSLAGDGYAYLIQNQQLSLLSTGKTSDGEFRSNQVLPLPCDPGPTYPRVENSYLVEGEAVFVCTDGIGDDIQDGSTRVGDYFAKALSEPVPAHELLRITSYLRFQSLDDRGMMVVWA